MIPGTMKQIVPRDMKNPEIKYARNIFQAFRRISLVLGIEKEDSPAEELSALISIGIKNSHPRLIKDENPGSKIVAIEAIPIKIRKGQTMKE